MGSTQKKRATNIHPNAQGFVFAAGAILGICAGLLWSAQGSIMLAYPTEQDKGKYIAIFWAIFNLGGVVGASVALGLNFHSEVSSLPYVVSSHIADLPIWQAGEGLIFSPFTGIYMLIYSQFQYPMGHT